MRTDTAKRIIEYINSRNQATAKQLVDFLGISRQALFKHLASLVALGQIIKIGRSPKVFYLIKKEELAADVYEIDQSSKKSIDENFLLITPTGQKLEGMEGFAYWCKKQGLPVAKTAIEYKETIKKYNRYKKDGLINGMYKIKNTFDRVYLDKVFYLEFYSIERFGKTKLGQLLLYAKQSQDKNLIKELVTQIKRIIEILVEKSGADAMGFIPPTVKREVQLMQELERNLDIALPSLKIVKVKTPVVVPQKTLNKLEDRIENARNTIIVDDSRKYKTILLIDDALGSGATMNETAKKIKNQKLAENVIGLAITGSFSGFEVISEV